MAHKARHRLKPSCADAALVQGRGEAMPWANQAFDTVVATFPAPYILAAETLAECARVLCTPGGRVVIGGLWVTLANARLASLWPVFYGTPRERFFRELNVRLAQHGFSSILIEREHAWARVGILVADLCVVK
jgi:hypothetical protein